MLRNVCEGVHYFFFSLGKISIIFSGRRRISRAFRSVVKNAMRVKRTSPRAAVISGAEATALRQSRVQAEELGKSSSEKFINPFIYRRSAWCGMNVYVHTQCHGISATPLFSIWDQDFFLSSARKVICRFSKNFHILNMYICLYINNWSTLNRTNHSFILFISFEK